MVIPRSGSDFQILGWSTELKGALVVAAAMLLNSTVTIACEGPLPMIGVQYVVDEQLPERVEATITNPLEKLLAGSSRLADLRSTTGHGSVAFEMRFDGGATEQDVAMVKRRVDELILADKIKVISTKVFLTRSCILNWPQLSTTTPKQLQMAQQRY